MTNITIPVLNMSLPPEYIMATNQRIYVEDLCMPYVQSLDSAYITIAIFNVCYSFTYPLLRRFKDKVFFSFMLEGSKFSIGMKEVITILDIIFFMLNFFAMGYYLLLGNLDILRGIPVIGKWLGG